MDKKKIKIIIGTANFDSQYGLLKKKTNKKEIISFINNSKKINFLEVSEFYKSSLNLAKIVKNKKLKIILKIGFNSKFNFEKVHQKFLTILKKINKEKVHSLFIHHSKDFLNNYEVLNDFFYEIKKNKIVNKIGISVYDESEIIEVLKYYKFDILQVPLNLFNQKFAEKKYIKFFKKKNVEVHVRSIFLQGLLLSDAKQVPKKLKYYKKNFLNFEKFIENKSINKLQSCLNFIKFSGYNNFVIGINSVDQLKEILFYLNRRNIKKIDFSNFTAHSKLNKLVDPRLW